MTSFNVGVSLVRYVDPSRGQRTNELADLTLFVKFVKGGQRTNELYSFNNLQACAAIQFVSSLTDRNAEQRSTNWIRHGLRRTNEDKQRAVQAALRHPKSTNLSDREIARHVGVDHQTVANWRSRLSVEFRQIEPAERTVTRNGTTYQQHHRGLRRHRQGQAPTAGGATRSGVVRWQPARGCLLASRPDWPRRTWIIDCASTSSRRRSIASRFGAQVVLLDPG